MRLSGRVFGILAPAVVAAGVWWFLRPALPTSPAAQQIPANRQIRLRSHVIELPEGKVNYVPDTNVLTTARGTLAMLVQLEGPADTAGRLLVEAAEARVIGVIPPCGFLVEATRETAARLSADPKVKAVLDCSVTDKLSPRLALDSESPQLVTVRPLFTEDLETVRRLVEEAGGRIVEEKEEPRLLRVELKGTKLSDLARCGEVRWIERYVKPKFLNDVAVNPGLMSVRPVWDVHGLTGRGQFITTSDTGIDTGDFKTMHPDFLTNLVGFAKAQSSCNATDVIGHGTHTAGSIVGDGAASGGQIRGAAPEAKLWAWFCCGSAGGVVTPTYLSDLFRPSQLTQGKAFIHSASWGGDQNVYTVDSQAIDAYVWSNPDFLPVFAAGNGWQDNSGAVTNAERAIDAEAAAKNVLAVGASENLRPAWGADADDVNQVAYFSSRGPMPDGRIKPDIVTPGTFILSTKSSKSNNYWGTYSANPRYAYNGGTSMSCPLAAGAMALVRQWLVERRGYTNAVPTSALMKAVVMGGAAEMYGQSGHNVVSPAPNKDEGWGRMDLEGTLYPTNGLGVRLYDRIPFAGDGLDVLCRYPFTLTNEAPLTVQLAWVDYPADPSAELSLVNDLDLVVSNLESGVVYTPDDHVNNAETVRLSAAPAGQYAVHIRCPRIVYDVWDGGAAALYLRGAFAESDDPSATEGVSLTVAGVRTGDARMSPGLGRHVFRKGTELMLRAEDFDYWTNAGGRLVSRLPFQGFTGTGSVPESGTTNEVLVRLETDSSVTWRWSDRPSDHAFRLAAMALHGSPYEDDYVWLDEWEGVVRNSEILSAFWAPVGTNLVIRVPDDLRYGDAFGIDRLYYVSPDPERGGQETLTWYPFSAVLRLALIQVGDATDARQPYYQNDQLPSRVDVTMDQAHDVVAWYVNDAVPLDGFQLPYWWYLRYLSGADDLSDAYVDGGDPDGDGFDNLAECRADTNPLDDAVFPFRICSFSPSELTFFGSVKGSLIVETCARPGDDWREVWRTEGGPRASTTNRVDLTPGASSGFYRVRHQK